MTKLAMCGGEPVITKPFQPYQTIGPEECRVVQEVMQSGVLSDFIGSWNPKFYGGARVRAFEAAWAGKFNVAHAIAMNSATSCLYATIGALGISPGDEVIVTPYTMCATASAIVLYGAIPVFADIEEHTFGLDPASVRARVTRLTKGILVTNLFGHPARLAELKAIADEYNIPLIEDSSQAITARYHDSYAGTFGDVGIFSLNYHKHIHTGEGGVCVTNNDDLAERLRLIRNHAEAVVGKKGTENIVNMLGFNFRLGEIEAAIGVEQLKKVDVLVQSRQAAARELVEHLRDLPGLVLPREEPGCTHAYYTFPIRYQPLPKGPHRDRLAAALKHEGVPISAGYVRPLYLEPMYQRQIAFGAKGYPFVSSTYTGSVSYQRGICPVVERIQDEELIHVPICSHKFDSEEIALVGKAFCKVFENLDQISDA